MENTSHSPEMGPAGGDIPILRTPFNRWTEPGLENSEPFLRSSLPTTLLAAPGDLPVQSGSADLP